MRAFLKAQGGGVWRSFEVRWTAPTTKDEKTGEISIKEYESLTIMEQRSSDMNDKALNAIFGVVDSSQYWLISNCLITKEAWDILQITHEGNEKVKTAKFQILMNKFENLKMDDQESITDFHGRIRDIANQAERLDNLIYEESLVLKVMRALPDK